MNNIDIKTVKDTKMGVEKIEQFINQERYMIKHFINALNHLILVEMDINEWINKKEKQVKIIPYYKNNDDVVLKFGADDFLYNKPFPLIEAIDAYGSALYNVNGINTILLNTYGESENISKRYNNTNYIPILPICFIYNDYIEVADIVINKKIMPRKKFFIYNHMIGKIPKDLKDIKIGGNNAFSFYPTDRLISLKILSKDYKKIPIIYRHLDSEHWELNPYIKINLDFIS